MYTLSSFQGSEAEWEREALWGYMCDDHCNRVSTHHFNRRLAERAVGGVVEAAVQAGAAEGVAAGGRHGLVQEPVTQSALEVVLLHVAQVDVPHVARAALCGGGMGGQLGRQGKYIMSRVVRQVVGWREIRRDGGGRE